MAAYGGDLLDHLRSFSVLAAAVERRERAAFTRAASELAVDVSVLRRRLQTLAGYVGAPLLEGRGASLRLTRAGSRVRSHGVRALDAVAELAHVGEDDVGPLRVACTGTILGEVLPSVFRTMRKQHPQLGFRARRAGAEASRALLGRGEIDFAVIRSAARPDGLASQRLAPDRLYVALPSSSTLARSRRPTLAALAKEPLVGYPGGSATMRRVMEVMGPLGATPWIEVDGKVAALGYVAEGLGIAFVSVLAGQRPERRGAVLFDVTTSFAAIAFWLVWPEGAALSSWQRRFVELMASAT